MAVLPRRDRTLAIEVTATLLAGAISRDGHGVLALEVIQDNLTRMSGVAVQLIKAVDRHMAPVERGKAKRGER